MRASFHTFGCKLNQYETEALASEFRNQGFSLVSPDLAAEVYVINTCTVTSKSEQKARRLIRKISRQRSGSLVIVTGCYAQLNREELAELGSNVHVVPQEGKAALLDLPGLLKDREFGEYGMAASEMEPRNTDPFDFRVDRFSYHSRAFLKVQDGCDYRCSYCRVPLARGRALSLDPQQAVRRVREMEERGYREVVITGVNLTAYQYGPVRLPALLSELLAGTDRFRLRLSSLEPEMINPELTEVLRDTRICPHFHIPIQSGSDTVLLRMRRRYRSNRVEQAVDLLRRAKDDPFLAADMIVGFPGETEEDFQASFGLAESLGLSRLHVFPFSSRPGTAAEHLPDSVPEEIRRRRVRELLRLSEKLHDAYGRRWLGKRVEVVLERGGAASGRETWRGLSENYLKVLVEGVPDHAGMAGAAVAAVIEEPGNPCRAGFVDLL